MEFISFNEYLDTNQKLNLLNQTMFVFIVPLKSPVKTDSWQRLSLICERTLRSICAQTSSNFRVIVVCNQKPDVTFDHPSINYIEVEDNPSEYGAKDKWRKIKIGLLEAAKLNPQFIMHCDADDCISNRLVAFSEQNPESPGWYFPTGWFWNEGDWFIFNRDHEFHTLCGTCRIINFQLLQNHLNDDEPLSSHRDTAVFGTPLQPLPFKASIYIRGHGENLLYFITRERKSYKKSLPFFSKKNKQQYDISLWVKIKQMRHYRWITKGIRQEFGLYELNE